jgi:hypothetical protein
LHFRVEKLREFDDESKYSQVEKKRIEEDLNEREKERKEINMKLKSEEEDKIAMLKENIRNNKLGSEGLKQPSINYSTRESQKTFEENQQSDSDDDNQFSDHQGWHESRFQEPSSYIEENLSTDFPQNQFEHNYDDCEVISDDFEFIDD